MKVKIEIANIFSMNEFARKQLLKTSSREHTDDNWELPAVDRLRDGKRETAIVCVARKNCTKAPVSEKEIAWIKLWNSLKVVTMFWQGYRWLFAKNNGLLKTITWVCPLLKTPPYWGCLCNQIITIYKLIINCNMLLNFHKIIFFSHHQHLFIHNVWTLHMVPYPQFFIWHVTIWVYCNCNKTSDLKTTFCLLFCD